jgi:hypothetical protein
MVYSSPDRMALPSLSRAMGASRKGIEGGMTDHYLIPDSFFTREQWRGPLAPCIDDLISKPGGCLLTAVTVEPMARNYPEVAFAVFDAGNAKRDVPSKHAAARERRLRLLTNWLVRCHGPSNEKKTPTAPTSRKSRLTTMPRTRGLPVVFECLIPEQSPDLSNNFYETPKNNWK